MIEYRSSQAHAVNFGRDDTSKRIKRDSHRQTLDEWSLPVAHSAHVASDTQTMI